MGLQVQIPVLGELALKTFAIEMLSGIALKPEPPLAPDVVHMALDAAHSSSASRYLHHNLGIPPHRPRNVLLLRLVRDLPPRP